jgi:MarR family transcriptional regulator for hemolysin
MHESKWFTLQTIYKVKDLDLSNVHLGKVFGQLTKRYIGVLTGQLTDLDIERYFYVIHLIASSEQRLTQKELTCLLHVDKASMVRISDYLEQHGYLERMVNPDDRREQFLILTAKGEAVKQTIADAFAQTDEIMLAPLQSDERKEFMKQLLKVMQHADQLEVEPVHLEFTKEKSTQRSTKKV